MMFFFLGDVFRTKSRYYSIFRLVFFRTKGHIYNFLLTRVFALLCALADAFSRRHCWSFVVR